MGAVQSLRLPTRQRECECVRLRRLPQSWCWARPQRWSGHARHSEPEETEVRTLVHHEPGPVPELRPRTYRWG